MLQKIITLSLASCLASSALVAQSASEPTLNPLVQQHTLGTQSISAPSAFALRADALRTGSYPLRNLASWAKLHTGKATPGVLPLSIGVRGDKAIRSVAKHIPNRTEGYYLSVDSKGVTIAGHDERGLFYGLQTLRQMLADGRLTLGSVTDYPDVPYRGVVEGFYGTPWSYEDRLSQLDFYGRNKLNVYIYGPKDDPYHSVPNWRKPYPTDEAKQIQSLVRRAHDNGVIFYWAIHPGQDIKWNDEDRDTLIKKFEAMYELGVRGFAVFFDDISGEGTKADKQAELLNYIDEHFVKPKKDVAPLIMCPTEYNKSWSNIAKGYLPTLGDKLNKGIEIMWTGNRVVATLDKPDVEWINQHIKRKAYVWFNFPVSDFVRNRLLLGETYGNSLEIADMLSGFLSNPMEHAESSKIALYSVADYTWNMKAYDTRSSWLRAMPEVLPEAPEALRIFAEHSSALGENGHRFDREESRALQPELKRLREGSASREDIQRIVEECRAIRRAANRLLATQSNPNMIDEMKPWLQMARLVAEYGEHILTITSETSKSFPTDYEDARALQRMMYLLDTELNQNPYQPGVKYGTQHLLPALNAHYERLVRAYNSATGSQLVSETSYKPFVLTSDIAQLSAQPITTQGKQIAVSPSNEVIKWHSGNSLTLTAKQTERIHGLSIDLGSKDIASKLRLELLIDGQWQGIALSQKAGETALRPSESIDQLAIQGLRLSYTGEDSAELRLRHLRFTLK